MVLIEDPSLPTSVWSSASGIRAVRSPREVISLAVLVMSSSGSRPRPMSHSPPSASRAMRAVPVMSSAMMKPRTWELLLLTDCPTNRMESPLSVPLATTSSFGAISSGLQPGPRELLAAARGQQRLGCRKVTVARPAFLACARPWLPSH